MLTIQNLQAAYGSHLVLDQLEATFQPGKVHGILGLNGSGKTTLFNTLYGFLPPTDGNVLFDNQPLQPNHIAYLETNNYFYPWLRGREYLQLLAQGNPSFNIDHWNSLFDLPLDGLIENYSTGMKKKLAFLGTLTFNRPILILDEPFNGVDVESSEKIELVLQRLKQLEKTILLSSHIIHSLTEICDSIFLLRQKRFSQVFQPDEFDSLTRTFKQSISQQTKATLDQLLPDV